MKILEKICWLTIFLVLSVASGLLFELPYRTNGWPLVKGLWTGVVVLYCIWALRETYGVPLVISISLIYVTYMARDMSMVNGAPSVMAESLWVAIQTKWSLLHVSVTTFCLLHVWLRRKSATKLMLPRLPDRGKIEALTRVHLRYR